MQLRFCQRCSTFEKNMYAIMFFRVIYDILKNCICNFHHHRFPQARAVENAVRCMCRHPFDGINLLWWLFGADFDGLKPIKRAPKKGQAYFKNGCFVWAFFYATTTVGIILLYSWYYFWYAVNTELMAATFRSRAIDRFSRSFMWWFFKRRCGCILQHFCSINFHLETTFVFIPRKKKQDTRLTQ